MTMPGEVAPRDRLTWLDYAKTIGIVLVVFAHASRSIGRTSGLVWSDSLQTLDGVIYAFHMPLFFLLAGYAASLQARQSTQSFARSLWWGVAVPYVVWSAIWIGLKVFLPEAANVPLGISALGKILWQPVEHFWFLYHLFFIRVGWYGIHRLDRNRDMLPAVVLIAAIVVWAILKTAMPSFDWAAGFIFNFAIYGLGTSRLQPFLQHWSERPALALCTLGAALSLCGIAIGGTAATLLWATGGALVVCGLAKTLPHPSAWVWRAFAFLGEASLAIYVMHLIVGATVRAVLSKSGLLTESTLLVSATLAGLLVPAVAYWIVLSAAQAAGYPLARWSGLGPATRSAYVPLWLAAPPKPSLSAS